MIIETLPGQEPHTNMSFFHKLYATRNGVLVRIPKSLADHFGWHAGGHVLGEMINEHEIRFIYLGHSTPEAAANLAATLRRDRAAGAHPPRPDRPGPPARARGVNGPSGAAPTDQRPPER